MLGGNHCIFKENVLHKELFLHATTTKTFSYNPTAEKLNYPFNGNKVRKKNQSDMNNPFPLFVRYLWPRGR